jgi:hypothetical protein
MTNNNLKKIVSLQGNKNIIAICNDVISVLQNISKLSTTLNYPFVDINKDYEFNSFVTVTMQSFSKNISSLNSHLEQKQLVTMLLDAQQKCNQVLRFFQSIKAKRG